MNGNILRLHNRDTKNPSQTGMKSVSGSRRVFCLAEQLRLFSVTLVELVNAPGDVHEFLFAGEERMAIRADTDTLFFSRGADFPNFPASANHFCRTIIRMDSFFHLLQTLFYGVILCKNLFSVNGSIMRP